MASSSSSSSLLFVACLALFGVSHSVATEGCYTSIFSFGDSITDTGNLLISVRGKNRIARYPYGETFFHRPTGRYTDGRVILDFIAEAMGMPLLNPYLGGGDFSHGANFAVGGATALDTAAFVDMGLDITWTDLSLSVQVQWFKGLLPSLCSSDSDCHDELSNALFLVGEIGGNDYNHQFFGGRTLEEIQSTVPNVIDAISSTINEFIELGARTLIVPGNFPIGCISAYLATFQSSREEDYDPHTGCIKWLNEFSEYHNHMLLEELDRIRQRHPYATIMYADYYNAAMGMFRAPNSFGFREIPLSACCGGGGPYNYNLSAMCGTEVANVCSDPTRFVCWDGMHLTEAAYETIANAILNEYTVPSISQICPQIVRNADKTLQGSY